MLYYIYNPLIMLIFQILLIIIIILVIIYIIYHNLSSITLSSNEQFDEKVTDATYTNCGQICTKLVGCAGFVVNPNTNTCYLSKTPILGRPEYSIFNM